MPRDSSRISATRPVFPRFLLPPFAPSSSLLAARSPTVAPAAAAASDPPSSSSPSPPPSRSAPPDRQRRRLARAAPDTLRCINCSTDLAPALQIVSKGFTGRYGRAFLVAPALVNVRAGRSEDRQLVTGWHVVADICCATCSRKLGWRYVDAREPSQRYKVGKYILEVERVVTHRRWEDLSGPAAAAAAAAVLDDVVFDSDDEDECDDIFAGVWDAATVAKRRSQAVARHPPAAAP